MVWSSVVVVVWSSVVLGVVFMCNFNIFGGCKFVVVGLSCNFGVVVCWLWLGGVYDVCCFLFVCFVCVLGVVGLHWIWVRLYGLFFCFVVGVFRVA